MGGARYHRQFPRGGELIRSIGTRDLFSSESSNSNEISSRGKRGESRAHFRACSVVLNFIATHVSDGKKKRWKQIRTFIAWLSIIRVWSSLILLINLVREFRGVVQLLEKIKIGLRPKPSWRATRKSSLELGRAISCEMRTLFRFHPRARYFLMYLSAISAPGTSSEFDELDEKG